MYWHWNEESEVCFTVLARIRLEIELEEPYTITLTFYPACNKRYYDPPSARIGFRQSVQHNVFSVATYGGHALV